ncbi:hypothetical protein [Agromyces sp. C10]|uniref:arsenate reductase/protein-tyrosine-phosphatase family protein n=1 Tax=Agromyces sp. C10 TaxID=2935077 RepID=UPI00200B88F3|nr:hypothetical protein [Agromyces sp. C10]MCK8610150.1 hypothetical protein [Agromyces sp. C10]
MTGPAESALTVLLVCTGNVNRSALGHVLLEAWSRWYLPADTADQVMIRSAGLRAPEGSTMGRRAQTIARALGVDGAAHRARRLEDDDLRGADLVLVSSVGQRDRVLGLVPAALQATFTIREAGRIARSLDPWSPPETIAEMRARIALLARNRGPAGGEDDDIIDPQGRDDAAYRLMARQEVPALTAVAECLFGMSPAEAAAYREAVEASGLGLAGDAAAPDAGTSRGRRRA